MEPNDDAQSEEDFDDDDGDGDEWLEFRRVLSDLYQHMQWA